ncbi:hypothetical protein BDN71DRAFT_851395 [Pleurotus eryngii]|uniref:Uncharacterized protein n=1 Tax=Pleurotus eryngii TaxID=5323 RepID=A0A9P6ABN4_PLEER|nr:hypothetical protein BDN71DRAFT_851395 [Pleurotus eryngii]
MTLCCVLRAALHEYILRDTHFAGTMNQTDAMPLCCVGLRRSWNYQCSSLSFLTRVNTCYPTFKRTICLRQTIIKHISMRATILFLVLWLSSPLPVPWKGIGSLEGPRMVLGHMEGMDGLEEVHSGPYGRVDNRLDRMVVIAGGISERLWGRLAS